MKRICNLSSLSFLTIYLTLIFVASCKTEDPNKPKQLPVLTTSAITKITQNTAITGGNITSDNGLEVSARGVCWSLKPNPTVNDSITKDAAGTGEFVSNISNLIADTTYYLRAYATNSDGTAYGLQATFETLTSVLPVLSTVAATDITVSTATSGGIITFNGGTAITVRGVCWGTSQNPTILNDKTSDGEGNGTFTSNITNLLTGANYYIRAYATNKAGTGYGTQITFRTQSIPTLTTTIATSTTATASTSGGNITSDGGADVTARGVCWSTTVNPTIGDNKTSNGSGVGLFISSLTGLTVGTTYYVRSYATNSIGTAYGNQVSLTTQNGIIILTTSPASAITSTTSTSGGNITSDGGAVVTSRGICWSTTSNPTITDNKTSNGTGSGTFTSSITGLILSTTYYIRSYATNSFGTVYGNQASFSTNCVDIDGNEYKIITIGTQTWMVENLKTTKYNDETAIPFVTSGTTWGNLTTGAYCFYNNLATYLSSYGALYNWYAVNTGKLAPTGWHVASEAEWSTLESYVSANLGFSGNVPKALAATTNWNSYTAAGAIGNNLAINNSSGFTALPGGGRVNNGAFDLIGKDGIWWCSTDFNSTNAKSGNLDYGINYLYLYMGPSTKSYGFSVRCIKN